VFAEGADVMTCATGGKQQTCGKLPRA